MSRKTETASAPETVEQAAQADVHRAEVRDLVDFDLRVQLARAL